MLNDDTLLQELAKLFTVEPDGSITWPWMTERTLAQVGSPELEQALREYRERNGIKNFL